MLNALNYVERCVIVSHVMNHVPKNSKSALMTVLAIVVNPVLHFVASVIKKN